MSLTVQAAIDMVRSRHPAFSRYMVPDRALADFFTTEQQRLMSLALMRDRSYLAQSLSIAFDLQRADLDAPGTAGAGTTGGVPGVAGSPLQAVQATTGAAAVVTPGTVFVSDTSITASSATTLTGFAVAWTVNAYTNQLARIVAGKGAGSAPRTIASNTATILTVSAPWEVTPDTTSVFQVVAPVQTLDGTMAAVTDLPAVNTNRGYLVKLNAQGVPYLDYTTSLVSHVSRGVPLPSYHSVLGGTVRYLASAGAGWATPQADYGATPLTLVSEAMRYAPPRRPAAYVRGSQLYLIGARSEWDGVESIDLTYVPVPPSFTARTDLFLLPDTAMPCLAARGALFAASRITGIEGVPQPPADILAKEAADAEASFLMTISLTKRARFGRVRPGG